MEVSGEENSLETINWHKLKNKDHEAFQWIYEKYWKHLYIIAFNFTNDRDQAGDLIQDVFVDLWKNAGRIDVSRPPLPYLRSITRFKVISYLRHLSVCHQKKFIERVQNELYAEGISNLTNETIAYNELNSHIETILTKLPEKTRTIFEMSRFKDYTNREIAGQLDVSIKTVEYHIGKALLLMKPQMRHLTDAAWVTFFLLNLPR